jgi:L-serine dehydratase
VSVTSSSHSAHSRFGIRSSKRAESSQAKRKARLASQALAAIGLADLFKIGIGPSSSHTMGPMLAARRFALGLAGIPAVQRIQATAYGSLAWTGKGHWTDKAMVLGLAGEEAEHLTPKHAHDILATVRTTRSLHVAGGAPIAFDTAQDIVFDKVTRFAQHPNAMTFEAFDATGASLKRETWFSIGGGFVEREGDAIADGASAVKPAFPVSDCNSLLALCEAQGSSLTDIALANELRRQPLIETEALIDRIAEVMFDCIDRGLATDGELPGGLKVRRRAKGLYDQLRADGQRNARPPDEAMRYVSAFAIAVNEENAAGHRVVTAPTNGAAGVVPAVLRYYRDFCDGADQAGIRKFFLGATIIGAIIKQNASISGAEVGCQGEVGSAAAMAAAGLTAALGGTNEQIENAAEIAIEHHLGMTCDPVGGLVQIPCIERNAFGAVKAITAASLALQGDGLHRVTLDQAIETMRQTGADMKSKYRETSRGGLAVNVPEC